MQRNNPKKDNQVKVDRPRLDALFAKSIKRKLTFVIAGAGYGKTRATVSFLSNCTTKSIWFQVTEADNQKSRFWEHFVDVVRYADAPLASKLKGMGFPEESQMLTYSDFVSESGSGGENYIFVFDDLHYITSEPVLKFISDILNNVHDHVSIVVNSRTEPAINIMPMAVRDEVSYISEDDLRFTKEEADSLFALMGVQVSARDMTDIYEDTVGWAFALNLIAMHLKRNRLDVGYARKAMKSNIAELMEADVFAAADEDLQHLLLRMSLVDNLTMSLAAKLADDDNLISRLECVSAFVRYDTYIDGFRIHPMFRSFLEEKQDSLSADEKRSVWLFAAKWCKDNELVFDAIHYYEMGGDYHRLIELIYYSTPQQIPQDTAELLLDIVDRVPESGYEGILAYHTTRLRLLMGMGHISDAIDLGKDLVKKYSSLPPTHENSRILSGVYCGIGIGLWYLSPEDDSFSFDKYFEMGYKYYRMAPYTVTGPIVIHSVSAFACMAGTSSKRAIYDYIAAVERAVPFCSGAMGGCMAGLDLLANGELDYYKGNLAEAEQSLVGAKSAAEENGQWDIRNRALFYLMRLYMIQGDYPAVKSAIGELKLQLTVKDYHMRRLTHDIVISWFYIIVGRSDLVSPWLKGDFDRKSIGKNLVDFANFTKMTVYYVIGRYEDLLDFFGKETDFSQYLFGLMYIKLYSALCCYKLKDKERAYGFLRELYELSRNNDTIMPIAGVYKDMRLLVSSAFKDGVAGIPDEWLKDIVSSAGGYERKIKTVADSFGKDGGFAE